jgi:hypothetical protein
LRGKAIAIDTASTTLAQKKLCRILKGGIRQE